MALSNSPKCISFFGFFCLGAEVLVMNLILASFLYFLATSLMSYVNNALRYHVMEEGILTTILDPMNGEQYNVN